MNSEESVEVLARWEGGIFTPRHFIWRGHLFPVESMGRSWEDDDGWHALCMVKGGIVFELTFRLKPAGWWLKPPRAAASV